MFDPACFYGHSSVVFLGINTSAIRLRAPGLSLWSNFISRDFNKDYSQ